MPTIIEPSYRKTTVVVKVDDADPITGAYFRRPVRPTHLTITYQQNAAEVEPFVIHVEARGPEVKQNGDDGARIAEHLVMPDERPSWIVAAVRRYTPAPFAPDAVVTRRA